MGRSEIRTLRLIAAWHRNPAWVSTVRARCSVALEAAMAAALRDNTALSRFELDVEGHVAFANYRLAGGVMAITHTEVPRALRERGVGSRLVHDVLEEARARSLKVAAYCGFVRAYLARHPEYDDLVEQA